MDKLLESQNSLPGLLAVIIALMTCHLLFKMGEALWEVLKKKNEISDQSFEKLTNALAINTNAVTRLEVRLNEIEKDLSEIPKFKRDLNRLYGAVKHLAGENWHEIKQDFEDL